MVTSDNLTILQANSQKLAAQQSVLATVSKLRNNRELTVLNIWAVMLLLKG
jgi:hypothetical protein